jgi:hypothetical protein
MSFRDFILTVVALCLLLIAFSLYRPTPEYGYAPASGFMGALGVQEYQCVRNCEGR